MNTGGKVEKFEQLKVFEEARKLTNRIYEVTRRQTFAKDFGLVDQIRRAAVSVMSNIAEGFERGANKEFIQFLYIAKGSCGEVRTHLIIALDQGYIDKAIFDELSGSCYGISAMLSNFIKYLKSSPLKGPKFTP